MLTPYSAYLYFPGGGLAANWTVPVRLRGGNVLVSLFQDAAATLPLANPAQTDAAGLLEFHAAPGDYEALVGMEAQPVLVDASFAGPVWPDLYVHDQAAPAAVWTVNHYFGTQPSVALLGMNDQVEATVTHPSPNQTVITFSSPQAGTANLRR